VIDGGACNEEVGDRMGGNGVGTTSYSAGQAQVHAFMSCISIPETSPPPTRDQEEQLIMHVCLKGAGCGEGWIELATTRLNGAEADESVEGMQEERVMPQDA